jgi:Rrf2 family protein
MVALGRHSPDDLVTTRQIADEMAIPVRFLPQVMADLSRARLVDATTGRSGGYRQARPPDQISLLDVVTAIEGDSRSTECVLRGGPCGRDGHCDVHDVFASGQQALLGRLREATLASVVARRANQADERPNGTARQGRSARPKH